MNAHTDSDQPVVTCDPTADQDANAVMSPRTPPTVNAVDAEVDIEVLRTLPKQFCIEDERSANWFVRKIVAAREHAKRAKSYGEQECRRAEREEATLLFLFGRQLEMWVKERIDNLNGRRKSLYLPAGTVGFRQKPARLVVDDDDAVLVWAKANCPHAVITKEAVSHTALAKHFELTGELPPNGAHLLPATDAFFVR